MATKKVVDGQDEVQDFVSNMNETELLELQGKLNNRWMEINKEKARELSKTIKLGNYVLYSKNGIRKYCGIVEIIAADFIGIKKVGAEGKQRNKRISYDEMEAVSETLEAGWITEEEVI